MAALDLARCILDFEHHLFPVPSKVGKLSDHTLTIITVDCNVVYSALHLEL